MSASNSIDRKKLTRAIKLAKVHEIHRLTRKMKQLKAKKGTEEQLQKNQRKANNLVNHMDIIKDFDPDHVVTAILDDDVDKQDDDMTRSRLLQRLVNSKPIQDVYRQDAITRKTRKHSNMGSKRNISARQTDVKSSKQSKSSQKLESRKFSDIGNKNKALKSVYTSALNSDSSEIGDKKKNRLGQRQRQQLWIEKYGKEAKCLKKQNKSNKIKNVPREDKKRIKKVETASNQESSNLHPSWAASKLKKQQTAAISAFQGKRTLFNDDDDEN
ncbi:Serum response factor-binding protein 1 [Trichoplax sp. H2]|nr:Serum response factor-binding protein 1 [Trichoplax sp. H2]|eukprot:RDD46592.1 Serum response factor-binding protein 1 [Trichoplax sp. H2]